MRIDKATALVAAGVALCSLTFTTSGIAQADDHSMMVEQHGAQVMPFNMDKTMHIFTKTADGGVQTVVAKNAGDQADITLIQAHLRTEGARFATGNFSDPAYIHGTTMPGLAQLEQGAKQITIEYQKLPLGASIRFTTSSPRLVAAIHSWFDAQVRDHGAHAVMATSGSGMTGGMSHMNVGGMNMSTMSTMQCPMHQHSHA